MTKNFSLLFLFVLAGHLCLPAQKAITVEDIWQNYTFSAKSIPGFNFLNDGRHYTRLEKNKINQYDLTTGGFVKTLLDGEALKGQDGFDGKVDSYKFSEDESKVIITSEQEQIYRHSSKANFFIWDGKRLSRLYDGGKQMYATFNPQADKVAFVFSNNLYVKDLQTSKITQVTNDGKTNHIINGATDWVYEEEFAFDRGFQWSPDGAKIAFYRFDESQVPEFTMTNYKDQLYPEYVTFKYPKVGERNSLVTIHLYDVKKGKTVKADTGKETDQYIPRIKWTKDPNKLCIYRLNRHQNDLELLLADAHSGKTSTLFRETNRWYISEEVFDNIRFLKDGKHFLWSSEQDGWHHLYLYDMAGKLVRQLTKGPWEVKEFYGVDEQNGLVYFQGAKESPLQREIYSVGLKDGRMDKLNPSIGWNDAQFSSTFDYFVNTFSTANTAPVFSVYDRKGKLVRVIEDNKHIAPLQEEYTVTPVEFFDFTTSDKVNLNGWMIKPPDFDPAKKYPVFMYLYGGPGSQQVTDSWKGANYWWFQMLAQQGFVVACVDNRGTGGRGEEFKKSTYLQLGHYETIDQIEAAKYLGSLPFADKDRIGIFGWSYGGYMSTLCLLKGNDVFKAAIAVAPVTSWKWYDTIYTERYMRTLKENEDGYKNNSPVYFADRLKGNYLLVHGNGDDNVHFQNTAEMANALIEANKHYDTYFYPNRNHGIYGGNTRLHLFTKMTNFLHEKLKNDYSPVGVSVKP